MGFSIIIVNYNTKNFLKNCLDSIFKYYPGQVPEVIVVDNNSSDGSAGMVRKNFPAVKLIANQKNIGFGAANNQGAEAAENDFLFFLNSDIIIKEDIFSPALKVFAQSSHLGILAPLLLLPNNQPQPYAYGSFPSLLRLAKQKIISSPKVKLAANQSQIVDWVSGAAMAVRKKVFAQIGGFDQNFFMYFEDIDLCWRARQAGWLTGVCPFFSLIHFGGQAGGGRKQRKKHYYQSQDYFFRKHYGRLNMYTLRLIRWPYKKFLGF